MAHWWSGVYRRYTQKRFWKDGELAVNFHDSVD